MLALRPCPLKKRYKKRWVTRGESLPNPPSNGLHAFSTLVANLNKALEESYLNLSSNSQGSVDPRATLVPDSTESTAVFA